PKSAEVIMMKSSSSLKPEGEDTRRQRAELRRTYGNLVSNNNLNVMRQKQKALADQTETAGSQPAAPGAAAAALGGGAAATAAAAAATALAAAEPHEEYSLRRIASSFAHVCDLQGGCCDALPLEDSEQDAKEERAEVLIRSQTMPLPMEAVNEMLSKVPVKPLELPLASKEEAKNNSETRLAKILPYTMQLESRATERWMRLGSTVSALFRARRTIDVEESPMAQTRRLREHRELLEAFTRPFLYEPSSRD
ncbi:hypothetical protein KR032_011751, partial [Drosophila birchii]